MDRSDIRDFLTARRERVTPEQVGLPTFGGTRRVKGLRREEVALLAGVSVDYYIRLERGNLRGVSRQVLDALATALQLDEAERTHLHNLAAAQDPSTRTSARRSRSAAASSVRPSVQRILDAMDGAAAFVRSQRLDVVATNQLARALYAPAFDALGARPNLYRFTFLVEESRSFYRDWDRLAGDCVAMLRLELGRSPHDRGLADLVGELSVHSPEFAGMWASQRVMQIKTGVKRFHHPVVGDLELAYDSLSLVSDPDLRMSVYSPEPATDSADRFGLLGSWAATMARQSSQAPASGHQPAARPSSSTTD